MPNIGAAIWRTILNIKLLCFPRCVPELLLLHLPKIYGILPMHSNVTIKNVSWPHFSWPTLYTCGSTAGGSVSLSLNLTSNPSSVALRLMMMMMILMTLMMQNN